MNFLTGWGFKDSIASLITQSNFISPALEKLKFGEEENILIAWSLGGLYAIDLAYRFPDKYKKIIFVSSLPKFVSDKKNYWQGISRKYAAKFYLQLKNHPEKLMDDFLIWVLHPNKSIELKKNLKKFSLDINNDTHKIHLNKTLKLLFQTDYRQYYQSLTQEIFHIFGDRDAIMPVKKITKQLKGKIYIIPHAGHSPFLTHTDQFKKIIAEILYDE